MPTKKTSERTLARLTVDRPGAMSPGEILTLVCWLRKQARDLEADPKAYTAAGRFTARVIRSDKGLEAR